MSKEGCEGEMDVHIQMVFLQEMNCTPGYEANKDDAGSATAMVCVDVQ